MVGGLALRDGIQDRGRDRSPWDLTSLWKGQQLSQPSIPPSTRALLLRRKGAWTPAQGRSPCSPVPPRPTLLGHRGLPTAWCLPGPHSQLWTSDKVPAPTAGCQSNLHSSPTQDSPVHVPRPAQLGGPIPGSGRGPSSGPLVGSQPAMPAAARPAPHLPSGPKCGLLLFVCFETF